MFSLENIGCALTFFCMVVILALMFIISIYLFFHYLLSLSDDE